MILKKCSMHATIIKTRAGADTKNVYLRFRRWCPSISRENLQYQGAL